MTVLERINEIRLLRGWSVNYLAMEAGLTQSTLNNLYLRGAEPKLSTLRAVCDAFGISLADFFSGMENDDLQKNGTDRELLKLISALNEDEKAALLLLLRAGRDKR